MVGRGGVQVLGRSRPQCHSCSLRLLGGHGAHERRSLRGAGAGALGPGRGPRRALRGAGRARPAREPWRRVRGPSERPSRPRLDGGLLAARRGFGGSSDCGCALFWPQSRGGPAGGKRAVAPMQHGCALQLVRGRGEDHTRCRHAARRCGRGVARLRLRPPGGVCDDLDVAWQLPPLRERCARPPLLPLLRQRVGGSQPRGAPLSRGAPWPGIALPARRRGRGVVVGEAVGGLRAGRGRARLRGRAAPRLRRRLARLVLLELLRRGGPLGSLYVPGERLASTGPGRRARVPRRRGRDRGGLW
mmetsp:Transcript_29406/g.91468  ORF Transcript_29406/g.91468 Transcript_29406/m.91468 type:complete len:302 (+) Transcript_29406:332-1237(+)